MNNLCQNLKWHIFVKASSYILWSTVLHIHQSHCPPQVFQTIYWHLNYILIFNNTNYAGNYGNVFNFILITTKFAFLKTLKKPEVFNINVKNETMKIVVNFRYNISLNWPFIKLWPPRLSLTFHWPLNHFEGPHGQTGYSEYKALPISLINI